TGANPARKLRASGKRRSPLFVSPTFSNSSERCFSTQLSSRKEPTNDFNWRKWFYGWPDSTAGTVGLLRWRSCTWRASCLQSGELRVGNFRQEIYPALV